MSGKKYINKEKKSQSDNINMDANGGKTATVKSSSLVETEYLLSTVANRTRLMESLAQVQTRKTIVFKQF